MKKQEIEIVARYDIPYSSYYIVLPKGKTHKDIQDIWIKWGEGEITFKDNSVIWFEIDFSKDIVDDVKRPERIVVYDNEARKLGEF